MFVLCFQCKLHLRADVSILVEEAIALSVTLSGGTLQLKTPIPVKFDRQGQSKNKS